jgi:hypothetical protein
MKPVTWILLLLLFACAGNAFSQQRKQVLLDSYFNDEHTKDITGKTISYHYKWEETDNNGFSRFKDAFKKAGASGIATLYGIPFAKILASADIYIIVDPDTKKESPMPKYIQPENVTAIADWVRHGGVLLLMANDSANVELKHFNTLAERFGIHFNDDLVNHVIDDKHFEDGAIPVDSYNQVFTNARKLFMKDICSLKLSYPSIPILQKGDNTIIALTRYGRGTVIAVGDPWLYNEYTNGRLPKGFDNDKAADDLALWLIQQIPPEE